MITYGKKKSQLCFPDVSIQHAIYSARSLNGWRTGIELETWVFFLRDFLLPVAFKKLKGKLGKSFLDYKQSWLELEYLRESLQSLTICCLRHWESVVIPAGTDVHTVMFIVSLVSFSNYCPYIFALAILCAFPWVIWCNSSCSVFILNIAGSLQVTSYKNSLGKNNSCLSASFLIIVQKKQTKDQISYSVLSLNIFLKVLHFSG